MRVTDSFAHLISVFKLDGGSISFLRQKARAQKARNLRLLELSASLLYMNFALLKSRNNVKIHVQNEISPGGIIRDSCMLLHKGMGENGLRFAEEW